MKKLGGFPVKSANFRPLFFASTFPNHPPSARGKRLGFGPLSLRCRGWMTRHDTTGSGAQHQ